MRRYRGPFSVLPAYEPGHWNVTSMCAFDVLSTRAVAENDDELLAVVCAAYTLACRGGMQSLLDVGGAESMMGRDELRARCERAVKGRDGRLLRAKARGLLYAIEGFAGEGLLREREMSTAAMDYWRVRNGYERQLPELLAG